MKFLLSFSFIHILGFYLPSLPSYIFNSSNCKDDMCNSSRKCKNRLVKYHLGGFPLSPLGPGFPVCHTSIYTLYCIIVYIFKHPKCVNENQQRGNLSERVYSSQTGGVAPALREIYLSWARVALPLPTISFLIQHPRENWGGVVMNLKAKCLGIAR